MKKEGAPETLKDIGRRLRAAIREAEAIDVRIAVEVMDLANRWDQYRSEADGLEIDAWLRKEVHPTRTMQHYRSMAEAAKRGGPFADRVVPKALLWGHNHIASDKDFAEALKETVFIYRSQKNVPLSVSQFKRLARRFVGTMPSRPDARMQLQELRGRIERLCAQVRAGCAPGTTPVE